jgi:hypothetical protein
MTLNVVLRFTVKKLSISVRYVQDRAFLSLSEPLTEKYEGTYIKH